LLSRKHAFEGIMTYKIAVLSYGVDTLMGDLGERSQLSKIDALIN